MLGYTEEERISWDELFNYPAVIEIKKKEGLNVIGFDLAAEND
jgi:hypothetical protein